MQRLGGFPLKIGFVGTGFITEAMVNGLYRASAEDLSVSVSPRNADIARRLAEKYASVCVGSSNQDVVDRSTMVVLALRPSDARPVLNDLLFRPDHHIVSVIAGVTLSEARELVAPASRVTLAIPLPAMALGDAPMVITPPDPMVEDVFGRAGSVIQVEDEVAYAALGTSTAIMATQFALGGAVTTWLERQGVAAADARRYVKALFAGLARTAEHDPGSDYERLAREHATPGSFNDYLLSSLVANGSFTVLSKCLDALQERMMGRS